VLQCGITTQYRRWLIIVVIVIYTMPGASLFAPVPFLKPGNRQAVAL